MFNLIAYQNNLKNQIIKILYNLKILIIRIYKMIIKIKNQ